ncbi:MAG: ArsA family ATPase [Xanthomonadaceae bacterium]|nr:ArsA family ATPase [Xanthomonadaceae bacterium]
MPTIDATSHLIFISGKGGVGKTTVSQALAEASARKGYKTLWMSIEDPMLPRGERRPITKNLWHLNVDARHAFEEYIALKIRIPFVASLFSKNPLMQYMARAAPGIHELVILGKIWAERTEFDRVYIDLPSTGHGLTMFRATFNFSKLFQGGPIHTDTEAMLKTFADSHQTTHLIVSLPEEMPLTEAKELSNHLKGFFPQNEPEFIMNRVFPKLDEEKDYQALNSYKSPEEWEEPTLKSQREYAIHRSWLEHYKIKEWSKEFGVREMRIIPIMDSPVVDRVSTYISEKEMVS